jgi:DNA-binding GntR family transcriptional regulator
LWTHPHPALPRISAHSPPTRASRQGGAHRRETSDDNDAETLRIGAGQPLLQVTHRSLSLDGDVVEVGLGRYLPSRVGYAAVAG